jgi:hypothetical protein
MQPQQRAVGRLSSRWGDREGDHGLGVLDCHLGGAPGYAYHRERFRLQGRPCAHINSMLLQGLSMVALPGLAVGGGRSWLYASYIQRLPQRHRFYTDSLIKYWPECIGQARFA